MKWRQTESLSDCCGFWKYRPSVLLSAGGRPDYDWIRLFCSILSVGGIGETQSLFFRFYAHVDINLLCGISPQSCYFVTHVCRPVGRYCSYNAAEFESGTPEIKQIKTSRLRGHHTVYVNHVASLENATNINAEESERERERERGR